MKSVVEPSLSLVRILAIAAIGASAIACSGSSDAGALPLDSGSASGDSGASTDGGGDGGFAGDVSNDSSGDGGDPCDPPDMLIVLDRTMSMSKTPDGSTPGNTPAGHAKTKWSLAVEAVDKVTAAVDKTVRFGLELFPRDPGAGACVTLSTLLSGTKSTNPSCEPGEIVVEPALATSSAIAAKVPIETTTLCQSTPIGAAFSLAATELAKVKAPPRKQFAIFVSDGGDTCGKKDDPILEVDKLAGAGVQTFIVSFDATAASPGGVNLKLLNDLACAGHTAQDFAKNCVASGTSYRAAPGLAGPIYLTATNQDELIKHLNTAIGGVCCACGIK